MPGHASLLAPMWEYVIESHWLILYIAVSFTVQAIYGGIDA
jgi:hypothetical protein